MSSSRKPYKLWSTNRLVKKGITAGDLSEVKDKGRSLLGIDADSPIQIVLEEDGTEVCDDDYFTFLPVHTTFMVLRESESWRPRGLEVISVDEPDTGTDTASQERARSLIMGLQRDLTRIITFSNEDLQNVIAMKTADIASLVQDSEHYAKSLQESCQRHLDDRQQTSEALDLLRLYHSARQNSPYIGDESGSKKRKVEPEPQPESTS